MVCLSCVKEGYHAPRQGFLTGIGTGCTEGERGEVTGRRLGPLEGEREREREREREGSKGVEGRTPGRKLEKKREGSRGERKARLRRKTGKGEACLVGDCGGDAGVPARQKNNGPSS